MWKIFSERYLTICLQYRYRKYIYIAQRGSTLSTLHSTLEFKIHFFSLFLNSFPHFSQQRQFTCYSIQLNTYFLIMPLCARHNPNVIHKFIQRWILIRFSNTVITKNIMGNVACQQYTIKFFRITRITKFFQVLKSQEGYV